MDMLLAENSPIRQQLLEQKLAQFKDPKLANVLSAFMRSSVDLYPCANEDYAQLGNSRLGGLPDLPVGMDYPVTLVGREEMLDGYVESFGHTREFINEHWREDWQDDWEADEAHLWDWDEAAQAFRVPMQFIAQINCSELKAFQSYLPREGRLLFFLERWRFSEMLRGHVYYVAEDQQLNSGKTIVEPKFDEAVCANYEYEAAYQLQGIASIKMIATDMINNDNPHLVGLAKARLQALPEPQQAMVLEALEVVDDELAPEWQEQLKGYELIQLNEHGFIPGQILTQSQWANTDWQSPNLQALLVPEQPLPYYDGIASINSHGDSRYKAPELHAAAELGGNAEDYLVLLKVLYSEHSMRLNFIVHREDLTLGRFDRIYCIYDY
ncbi:MULTISPECIES: DUF1963 domain-containing protein [Aeromonas]|uniref:DUF1963 domain-containing protein n=1 Tax=Aeromonas TaxID=642 RepID=UPI000C0BFB48|nr:DUF1963 domain-containing protein [Aeromonas dhakensis]CAB5689653.1 Domain of uncharacterised function (DUF1963) [Aeromonas hydrophila]MDX7740894.1 DUF1963 domain-containing protein [Aeromonas dhakensis]PHS86570.1 hypothetical protein AAW03_10445 [Aeromonas dhakensis]PHS89523.1 hypothetical protein AAW02_06010 [Aeromonas dhakensis]WAF97844.1 YwqG family protein [Aeromonas dhakensis]